MKEIKTKITEEGSIVLPDDVLQALNLQVGDDVVMRLEDGELRIFTRRSYALKRAQDLVGRYVSTERSLADELISERRQERY